MSLEKKSRWLLSGQCNEPSTKPIEPMSSPIAVKGTQAVSILSEEQVFQ